MEDEKVVPTYAEVQKAILAFHEQWRRPGIEDLPARLRLVHFKDPVEWARLWAEDGELQKHSRKAGVYSFFDTDKNLLYVGSARVIGHRLYQHFHVPGSPPLRPLPEWVEQEKVQYVAILDVPDVCWFEALAIEAYLIEALSPPRNKVGKKKG
jgi:hypothetical protein